MTTHLEEYFYKEGCYIEEWLNDENHPDMSVARVRVEPGRETHLHILDQTVEHYVILDGSARVTVGDEVWHVAAKDVVEIAAGMPQKIKNLQQSDLLFLAICTPRFELGNYRELSESAK